MSRKLYSELRTIYETASDKPNTFRQTIKLGDLVDGEILRKAVARTMERYPYFRVRLVMEGDIPVFEENPSPVPVIHTNHQTVLGSEQTSGHLLCFCYWKNRLHIDAYHGLTDGGGIAPLLKTLLYYYCSEFYEVSLSRDDIRLSGDVIPQAEWDDPAAIPVDQRKRGLIKKWNFPAFQLADAGIANLTADGIVLNMRIPERAFMEFNISNDGSPATIVSLLLARTIKALHPDASLPVVIAMCVNQRRALRAPKAHQSLVGDVRLPFTDRMRKLPFHAQVTCFRGMVLLQSDNDMVLDDIRDYQSLMAHLKTMDSSHERKVYCTARMEELSRCVTASVSYVGKADLGDAERFILENNVMPSTALPSVYTPLTIELSAIGGYFFLNFIQMFHEEDYFSMFVRQFRKNNIEYDVLNVTEARFPLVELPL